MEGYEFNGYNYQLDKVYTNIETGECVLVPMEKGEMYDICEEIDYALMKDFSIEPKDIIEEISYIEPVDSSIEDVLILFNELGYTTYSSCSGLLEDHIDWLFYCEMDIPFIMFWDIAYENFLSELIKDTVWKIETRKLDCGEDITIFTEVDGDENVRSAWDILRERLRGCG